jgi:hypothetical protein
MTLITITHMNNYQIKKSINIAEKCKRLTGDLGYWCSVDWCMLPVLSKKKVKYMKLNRQRKLTKQRRKFKKYGFYTTKMIFNGKAYKRKWTTFD